jgi:RNA polymerase sigma factor (sigma-70 family)
LISMLVKLNATHQ